jgi:hypothetical protein
MTLIEPPNVIRRNPAKLLQAIKTLPHGKTARQKLELEYGESLSRILPEFSSVFGERLLARRDRKIELSEGIQRFEVNEALISGLSFDTFGDDLKKRPGSGRVIVGRGKKSAVCPTLDTVDSSIVSLPFEEYVGRGSEMIFDRSLVAKLAIRAIEPKNRRDLTPEDVINWELRYNN